LLERRFEVFSDDSSISDPAWPDKGAAQHDIVGRQIRRPFSCACNARRYFRIAQVEQVIQGVQWPEVGTQARHVYEVILFVVLGNNDGFTAGQSGS
jgi:hypothetical protein